VANAHLPILLLSLGLAACGRDASLPSPAAGGPLRVATDVVAWQPMPRMVEASGTVRGHQTAILTSRIVADVREVRVRSGDAVKAGQELVLLEDSETQAALRSARAAVAEASEARLAADGGVRAAEAGARLASVTFARMEKLLAAQVIARQEFDDAEARQRAAAAEEQMARARLAGGAARVAEAQAALAGAEAALGYSRIAAPFDGRVIERRVDPGSQAAPGQALLVIEQAGPVRVEAAFDESRVPGVAIGDVAPVELEAIGARVDGRVIEIVPAVDPTSRAFIVKLELPDAIQSALRPGMFARVRFPIGAEPRLAVKASAVVPAGQLDRVFVVEEGVARLRLVTVGARAGGLVEVLSGLSGGERVVARPPPGLRGGAAVEAVASEDAP
jgi:RND family efflux transporter MFP subunit